MRYECKDRQIDQNRGSKDKTTYMRFMSKVACRMVEKGEYQNIFSINGEEMTPTWIIFLKKFISNWILDLNVNIKIILLEDNIVKHAHYLMVSILNRTQKNILIKKRKLYFIFNVIFHLKILIFLIKFSIFLTTQCFAQNIYH